jgi:hypothetical protein
LKLDEASTASKTSVRTTSAIGECSLVTPASGAVSLGRKATCGWRVHGKMRQILQPCIDGTKGLLRSTESSIRPESLRPIFEAPSAEIPIRFGCRNASPFTAQSACLVPAAYRLLSARSTFICRVRLCRDSTRLFAAKTHSLKGADAWFSLNSALRSSRLRKVKP